MANCKCNNGATVTATVAAGDSASPFFVMANITKRLCQACCKDNPPVFTPAYSVVGFSAVAAGQYVATIQVQGCITYNPCGTCCCSTTEPVTQTFTVPFVNATTPTSVTIAQGATTNAISVPGCNNCGRTFVSETPLTITVA